MIEQTILGVVGFAGGIGITSVVTNGAIKAVPTTINTAEKVCVGIGAAMTSIAVERVVTRECEQYYKEIKKEIRRITKKSKKHYSDHKKYEKKENEEEK